MLREIILSVIINVDILLAAAAFSSSGIRIPLISAAVIDLICSAVLYVSMTFSKLIVRVLPLRICRILGAVMLITIGAAAVMKSLVRYMADRGRLSERLRGSPLAVKLFLDDTAADADHSKVLTSGEAAVIALASSVDCAATGLSCGYADISAVTASAVTFLCGAFALMLGAFAGRKISSAGHDLSWVGGLLLIIFAVSTA